MKQMVWIGLLWCCSCKLIKQKERMTKDSLITRSTRQEWFLHSEATLKSELLLNKAVKQAVLIIADAPFRWQADSGLVANAGHFQIYSRQQEDDHLELRQDSKNNLALKHQENERERQHVKSLQKQAEIKGGSIWLWPIGLAVLLLGIWRFIIWGNKRRR